MKNLSETIQKFNEATEGNNKNSLSLELANFNVAEAAKTIEAYISSNLLSKNISTLIYALGEFSFPPSFEIIIEIILHSNWGAAHEAVLLLDNFDNIAGEDVLSGFNKLKDKLQDKNIESWRKELISEVLDNFS